MSDPYYDEPELPPRFKQSYEAINPGVFQQGRIWVSSSGVVNTIAEMPTPYLHNVINWIDRGVEQLTARGINVAASPLFKSLWAEKRRRERMEAGTDFSDVRDYRHAEDIIVIPAAEANRVKKEWSDGSLLDKVENGRMVFVPYLVSVSSYRPWARKRGMVLHQLKGQKNGKPGLYVWAEMI